MRAAERAAERITGTHAGGGTDAPTEGGGMEPPGPGGIEPPTCPGVIVRPKRAFRSLISRGLFDGVAMPWALLRELSESEQRAGPRNGVAASFR